jgi:hypothetical protein
VATPSSAFASATSAGSGGRVGSGVGAGLDARLVPLERFAVDLLDRLVLLFDLLLPFAI